jgi:hypothetical protein
VNLQRFLSENKRPSEFEKLKKVHVNLQKMIDEMSALVYVIPRTVKELLEEKEQEIRAFEYNQSDLQSKISKLSELCEELRTDASCVAHLEDELKQTNKHRSPRKRIRRAH